MTTTEHPAPAAESTWLDVVNLTLRSRRVIIVSTLAGALLFAGLSLLVTPTYVARTAFIQADPSRTALSGTLGALASRFGFPGGVGEAALSLDFLQQTLTSQDVLDSVLTRPLVVPVPAEPPAAGFRSDTLDLAAWLDISEPDPAKRLDRLRRRILKRVTVEPNQRSGIVRLSVGLRDPHVAAALARALVEALNQFNLHTRQTVSRANRTFLEGRVEEAHASLQDAETALRQFHETNRRIADAPALLSEEERIKRRVSLAQEIYLTLAQQLEQARIDEVKDTPVLTVIETATPPVRRSSPRRKVLTLMGAFTGAALSILFLAVRSHLRASAAARSPAWDEFQGHVASLGARPRR